MMARYIDADALESKKFISWTCPEFFDEGAREQQAYQIGWNNAIEAVMENEPTADVVERKKGMWNIIQGNIVVCSVCGMNAPQSMTGCLINRHLEPNKSDFCPNCGADMRKEVK